MLRRRQVLLLLSLMAKDIYLKILTTIKFLSKAALLTPIIKKIKINKKNNAKINFNFLLKKVKKIISTKKIVFFQKNKILLKQPIKLKNKVKDTLIFLLNFIIKKVSHININKKIKAIIKIIFNINLAANMNNQIKIKSIIKNKFNSSRASNIFSLTKIQAIINEKFNIDKISKILSLKNVKIKYNINFSTSKSIHGISKNITSSNNFFQMWAGKPIYLKELIYNIKNSGLIAKIKNIQPLRIILNRQSVLSSFMALNFSRPLRFSAKGVAILNDNSIINTKTITNVTANLAVISASNINISTVENTWEYPVQTNTNLKITQVKLATQNNGDLEVE